MPRGGYRPNSGRPKGSKDKLVRVRRSYAALPDPAGLTVAQASAIFVSRRGQALEDAIYAGDDLRLQAEWFRWRASFAWGIPKKDASEMEDQGETPLQILRRIAEERESKYGPTLTAERPLLLPAPAAVEKIPPPEALPEIRPPALDPIHQRLAELGVRAH
jgi:hypothetical protein